MFYCHQKDLQISKDEVIPRLNKFSSSVQYKQLTDETFVIYKTLGKRHHNLITFRIKGSLEIHNSITRVNYRIRPMFGILIVQLLFFAAFCYTLVTFLSGNATIDYALMGFVIAAVSTLNILVQERICLKHFEKQILGGHGCSVVPSGESDAHKD